MNILKRLIAWLDKGVEQTIITMPVIKRPIKLKLKHKGGK